MIASRPLSFVLTAALVLASAITARSAGADAIDAPPLDCARGLRGASSHGGPFCALDLCAPGGVCTDGRTCVPRSYCVEARTGVSRGGPFVEDTATIPCAVDADCGGAGACRAADVCMDVEAHRLRGLILFSIGLVMLSVVGVLAVLSARGRRRRS